MEPIKERIRVMTSLIEQYKDVRSNSEAICKPLKVEDYVVQIAEFASPAKWQLAHSTWFFETFILVSRPSRV